MILVLITSTTTMANDIVFYVSTTGNDKNVGSKDQPFATWERARRAVRLVPKSKQIFVFFRKGTYYLENTVVLGHDDSGTKTHPVTYAAYPGENVIISGAEKLTQLKWKPWKNGIYEAEVITKKDFDQVFVNGFRKPRARFPNYDYENPLRSGKGYLHVTAGSNARYDTWLSYDSVLFSKKNWSNPTTGIVHAFQSNNWGNMQYQISGISRSQNKILLGKGGWQLQRNGGIGEARGESSPFFVENIFEELDQPGEWYFDRLTKKLFYYPLPEESLSQITVEVAVLKDLVQIIGTKDSPVSFVNLKGLKFKHAKTTFMEKYEPMSRGDWAIHRGGTVFMENTQNMSVEDCGFEYLGGNAIFVSKFNRQASIKGCNFQHIGESAVCFVGDPKAVRGYLTWDDLDIYKKKWNLDSVKTDLKAGPKSNNYPADCVVENCKAFELGDFGKQVAGVFISMSERITVRHCSVYDVPRAGICINDGTWGGHLIEHNDIWNTVRETGEHGPFNAWGRERFWLGPWGGNQMIKDYVYLDAVKPTIVRNNRISNMSKSISAGNWTIDLDDGSSNYQIYNNLSLGSTLKLRDGYYRKVWNNIFIGPVPIGWHVWPESSEDEFHHNIVTIAGQVPGTNEGTTVFFKPIGMPKESPWSNRIDSNIYYNLNTSAGQITVDKTLDEWRKMGYDEHSSFDDDPLFIDPKNGDYRINEHTKVSRLGFKNFPMDQFGHTMTRSNVKSKSFKKMLQIVLLPDTRGTEIRYTLDGTEPNLRSEKYLSPIKIEKSLTLKAQTFNKGLAVGYSLTETYLRDDSAEDPTWLAKLISPNSRTERAATVNKVVDKTAKWLENTVVNITDGDLIDATGGFESGAYLLDVDSKGIVFGWGLRNRDIIIGLNDQVIKNKEQLLNLKFSVSDIKIITIRRGYDKIVIKIDK